MYKKQGDFKGKLLKTRWEFPTTPRKPKESQGHKWMKARSYKACDFYEYSGAASQGQLFLERAITSARKDSQQ